MVHDLLLCVQVSLEVVGRGRFVLEHTVLDLGAVFERDD